MSMAPESLPLEIDCQSTKSCLDAAGDTVSGDVILIDCREPDEHKLVHIDAARLIPMTEMAARVAELEPFRNARVIVHCHHGGRSLRVVHWLRQQGFSQAQSMAGGIDQWAAEIEPGLPRY